NGVAHLLSVSTLDKIGNNDKFVIFRGRYSEEKTALVHDLIRDIAQKIADAFGLADSPMLIQMITDGKRAFVLEFSARTGGGVKFQLIRKASGFDVIAAVIDLTLGKKPHVDKQPPENKFILNDFIYCKPGVFDRVEGFGELKQQGVLSEYSVYKWQGAVFDIVDVAHLNRRSFFEVIECAEKVVCSHTAVEALKSHLRNLTDEQIRIIIQKGGVIGLTPVRAFVKGNGGVVDFTQTIDYCVQRFGVEHFCIATDYYGSTDFDENLSRYEHFSKVKAELFKLGYTKKDIDSLFYHNATRLFL
ncbi:MAG: membrane dipeptidase, partial [Clostridia bacterium]|nr:membrane dipeptidase [Clostridia bacterium]